MTRYIDISNPLEKKSFCARYRLFGANFRKVGELKNISFYGTDIDIDKQYPNSY